MARRPSSSHAELGDLLAQLAVAQLHRRAERRRDARGLGLGDAPLGHAPQALDAGVEAADLAAQPGSSQRAARTGAASAARRAAGAGTAT